MEIPSVERYIKEKEPKIDFLNENLQISFTIEQEVFDNLPRIDNTILEKDLESRREVFNVFLGDFSITDDNTVIVYLDYVLEVPDEEEKKSLYYEESELEISINLENIKVLVDNLKKENSEFKNVNFIGDIHTHPIKQEELKDTSITPLMPSDTDIASVVNDYKKGILSANRPFIFAIAGIVNNQMEYAFYRLVKKDDKYYYQRL